MSVRKVCMLGVLLIVGTSGGVQAQQANPMAGMTGMKDSSKAKPSPKKPKPKPKGKKKTATATPPMGGMTMPSPTKKKSPARRPSASVQKKHTEMSMPMGDTSSRIKHDSSMMMPAHDSMPGMPSMSAHADSTHPMPDSMRMHDSVVTHGSMVMPKTDSVPMPGMTSMDGTKAMTADEMMIGPLGVSMERMGSGTTWIPDAVTMPSRRTMMGSWMVMAHGFAFAQYDHQSGRRGDDQLGSLNWMMLMATKDVAGGRFQARTMLSLDALTVSSKGYPLLVQTGETFDGQPLHDRQHPHDFFMELGALYQRQLTPKVGWSIYAAPSGEPALGPVAFMHRPSAMDNPSAPISHHWQDATHVSFGAITGGLFTKTAQVEVSAFNGREPDQRRWNFDPIKIDSYSSRFTVNPTAAWSVSAGYGYLKSPEALNPKMSMHRLTASVLNGERIGADGQVASALIWGANKHSGEPGLSHSVLAESEAILDRRNTFFGRAEWVQKSAEELVVDAGSTGVPAGVTGFPPMQRFNVSTAQVGYIRELMRTHWATVGLGAAGTVNFVPSLLEPTYGSRTPLGLFVFLRLRPFHERGAAASTIKMTGHE